VSKVFFLCLSPALELHLALTLLLLISLHTSQFEPEALPARRYQITNGTKLVEGIHRCHLYHTMSSPLHDQAATNKPANTAADTPSNTSSNTAPEDPFISPDFHLRHQSLSTTSPVSITSSPTACSPSASSPGAPTPPPQRSLWCSPSSGSYLRYRRLRAIPVRWLTILFCLVATFAIWHWSPPSQEGVALSLSEYSSTVALQVLRPHGSSGSRPTDPEQWLNENSEVAVSRKQRWWKKSPTKPRAAIISLVRNEELEGIMQSMRQLEYHWNMKYQYPWVFFNEKPFSDEFKVYK
jgi:Glycolipid 2-alpha-mannosyltransferase